MMITRLCRLQLNTIPATLDRNAVLRTLLRATRAWEQAVPGLQLRWSVSLHAAQGNDIVFRFGRLSQGLGMRGPAETKVTEGVSLIVFSDAEAWHLAPKAGFWGEVGRWVARAKRDFLTVALHELGHALGLAHSEGEADSVMHPHAETFGLWSAPSELDAARLRRVLAICLIAGFLVLSDFKGGLTNSGPATPSGAQTGLRNALQRLSGAQLPASAKKGGVGA